VSKKEKKGQNDKEEIYNDKYRHTRDRLLGLGSTLVFWLGLMVALLLLF
jgi:hypothetical protein